MLRVFLGFSSFLLSFRSISVKVSYVREARKEAIADCKILSQGERKKILQSVQIHFCSAALRRDSATESARLRLGNHMKWEAVF